MTVTLQILTSDEDLESVRNVLGLTQFDVTDDLIQTLEFGFHAELLVREEVDNWKRQLDDLENGPLVKMAAVYATAALIAEQYAQGGTIGNVEGGDEKPRNWDDYAALMWGYHQRYMNQLKNAETEVSPLMTFMNRGDDIRAVRELLGPDYTSLAEEIITNTPFGQHSEFLVKEAINNWQAQWQGDLLESFSSSADWVAGDDAVVTDAPDSPPLQGSGSVQFAWTDLDDETVSDSVLVLAAPIDLSGYETHMAFPIWLDFSGDVLTMLRLRLEFGDSDNWIEYDIHPDVEGWQHRELRRTVPAAEFGLHDWSNLTALHVIAVGTEDGASTTLRIADLRAINVDTLAAFRLASIYGTAALLGESYAANTKTNKQARQTDRDNWTEFAAQMWTYQQMYLAALADRDPTTSVNYLLPSQVIASRNRTRPHRWFETYPPVWASAIDWSAADDSPTRS